MRCKSAGAYKYSLKVKRVRIRFRRAAFCCSTRSQSWVKKASTSVLRRKGVRLPTTSRHLRVKNRTAKTMSRVTSRNSPSERSISRKNAF